MDVPVQLNHTSIPIQIHTIGTGYGLKEIIYNGQSAPSSSAPIVHASVAPESIKTYTDARFIESMDVKMAGITREELDAKLGQNKAEVNAVAAEMRKEMADWRSSQTEIMLKMQSEISAISVKLDERFEAQKRSSALLQWMAGIILAIVALIPAFQGIVSKDTGNQQPIVIQVPQQQQSQK